MEIVKTLYGKAFWSLSAGVAMFFVFLLLLAHWLASFDWWLVAVGAAFFVFVVTPLSVSLTIEHLARDEVKKDSYQIWKLKEIANMGKQMMLYGNPIGWLAGILYWVALKAVLRWPTLGLYIAILLP